MSLARRLLCLVVVGVAAVACSGGDGDGDALDGSEADIPRLVAQTPAVPTTIAGADGADDSALATEAEVVLEGRVTNPYDLDVGECFNTYVLDHVDGGSEEITTVVDCDTVHDGEVYHQFMIPGEVGAAFPGDGELDDLAEAACYARFTDFVGIAYELSELGLGFHRPTVETWTGPGTHREITCYVEPYDSDLRLEGGSVAGRGL